MDRASVEKNFSLTPEVEGKFSWIGRKMAYSFTEGLQGGESLEVSLKGVKDAQGVLMKKPYFKNYQTAYQNLYFIGAEGVQKEKLVQFDFKLKNTKILSPKGLIIKDFKIHPNQKLIYLLGIKEGSDQARDNLYQLDLETKKLDKILDGEKEFIFSFDLSPDGKILLVRKGQVNTFSESSLIDPGSLWIFKPENGKWTEFWNKEIYGSEFFFSPDSNYIVGRLITGDITILPVKENLDQVVYLENYAGSYNLSPDGSKLVFVDFTDPFSPHDLLLRENDGNTKILGKGIGQIQFPIFDRKGDNVYFLLSLAEQQTGLLQLNPYHLYRYDLKEEKLFQLTKDATYFEGFFHVSSNGEKIAFERYKASATGAFYESQLGKETPSAEIWVYNRVSQKEENLNLVGLKPYLN